MDQQELYWTLAECVAWVRHRDDEAVNGCVDPGLSLEIPDEILQILRALRELHAAATGARFRVREGSGRGIIIGGADPAHSKPKAAS